MTPPSPFSAADREQVLSSQAAGWWEPLRGQRLFITGGTGFFGVWLLQSLAWVNEEHRLGAKAVVLSRNWGAFSAKAPALAADPAISAYAGDVRDFSFPAGQFSHVIHAATEPYLSYTAADRPAAFERDVLGTRRVLELARQSGARRLLFTSSGAVYGRQPPEMPQVAEEYGGGPDPTDPAYGYGHAKRLSECFCASYAQSWGIECAIARCFAFVGPYLPLDANYAVGNFIRDGLAGGPIIVRGDGTPYRSYLYAADLAVWLWGILLHGVSGRAYNVGSDDAVSIADLAGVVAGCFDPHPKMRILQTPVPGRPAERYVPSTRRAREELGLRQAIGLQQSIRRTIASHRTEAGLESLADD